MKNGEATLRICCHAPLCYRGVFLVKLLDSAGSPLLCESVRPNCRRDFFLPPGRYEVQLRGALCLNPRQLTKWICVEPDSGASVDAIFTIPLQDRPSVRLHMTASDAVYPGIIEINGGITACLQPNTP